MPKKAYISQLYMCMTTAEFTNKIIIRVNDLIRIPFTNLHF